MRAAASLILYMVRGRPFQYQVLNPGNSPKGNHRGWFIGVIPSFPSEAQQVVLWCSFHRAPSLDAPFDGAAGRPVGALGSRGGSGSDRHPEDRKPLGPRRRRRRGQVMQLRQQGGSQTWWFPAIPLAFFSFF